MSYDLQVTTEIDWTSAAMLLQLDAGHIYQHGLGGDSDLLSAPQAVSDAALAFDTHVKGMIAGGAGDLDGTGYAFTTDRLDVSWFNMDRSDIGTTTIARLTLSDDAAGTMALFTGGQRFDVVLGAGVAPVVTAVIEEEPEPEPTDYASPSKPDFPIVVSRPSWDYGSATDSVYACPTGLDYWGDGGIILINQPDLVLRKIDYENGRAAYSDPRIWNTDYTPRHRDGSVDLYGKLNFYYTEPDLTESSSPLRALPEPTSVVLFSVCLGALTSRQRA